MPFKQPGRNRRCCLAWGLLVERQRAGQHLWINKIIRLIGDSFEALIAESGVKPALSLLSSPGQSAYSNSTYAVAAAGSKMAGGINSRSSIFGTSNRVEVRIGPRRRLRRILSALCHVQIIMAALW